MKRLIDWSIGHHRLVLALSVLLAVAGAWTARSMPVDVFPDLTAPTVTILVEGRGMAPEELETLVTFPIETAINGASDVRRVRSATAVGIAVVWVEFDWGTDIFQARQVVAEKLSLVAGTLPPQVEQPVLAPISSIMGEILFFAISSEHDDPLALRTLADTVVRRRLLAVSGVSQVTPIGGAERQYQVIAHPDQLRAKPGVADRAARRGPRLDPEHVGGHLRGGAAGVRAPDHRPGAVGGGDRRFGGGAARRAGRAGPRSGGGARGRGVEARRGLAQRQARHHRRRAEAARRQHASS